MARTIKQAEADGYFAGYQAAMADIQRELHNGPAAVAEWVGNNTTAPQADDRCAYCHRASHTPETNHLGHGHQYVAPATNAELVEAVKTYAEEHYEKGGWDVIVECWTDLQIAEQIGSALTVRGAINKFRPAVSVWADRQADARNSAFFKEEQSWNRRNFAVVVIPADGNINGVVVHGTYQQFDTALAFAEKLRSRRRALPDEDPRRFATVVVRQLQPSTLAASGLGPTPKEHQ